MWASDSCPALTIWMKHESRSSPESLTRNLHLDDAAAKASVFGGLAASGWHTAAVAMRLLVDGGLPLGNGIIGMGGDLAWPKPTRPGDTLHVESEILEIVPSRSKPNQAIVKVRSTTLNQHGEPVHSFTSKCLVFKRPQSPE
jgi:acyl dehydratase